MFNFPEFYFSTQAFKSQDSSSTRNLTQHLDTVHEGVHSRAPLPSPHPLGINYRRVDLLWLLDRSCLPVSRWQVDVTGQV